MYPIIQPDALSVNSAKPIGGMKVGQIFRAVNPYKFPGDLLVMHIQASEAVASIGLALRQEMGILTSEGQLTATDGSTTSIVDADHGITAGWIDDDNPGYFYWINDSTSAIFECGEVAKVESSSTFRLYDAANDAVANADTYNIWKPGRMKVCSNDGVLAPWGVSCGALTDEYYGFMVVRGWWPVNVLGNGTAVVLGSGIVPGTSGAGKGVTAGTTDGVSQYAIAGVSTSSATNILIPAYVKTFVG